ncbi:MAG: MgtC/SapB family protein [Gammaproteobacteria bacterium]|jgi:uncharacterized membrane protein (DUF4010 family)
MQLGDVQQTFLYLGISLAVGLLIGVERGWKERKVEEGERVAGVRTYGLIGLLGGGTALIAGQLGVLLLGIAFLALAGILTAAYISTLEHEEDVGITSLIASMLTFVFGAMAGLGEIAPAAAFAVLTSLLLGFKPQLHHWVGVLKGRELRAGLQLLLISVVLLPILPDQGYGPWQGLNPYEIWWMVVLIASISFVGYFAIKIAGTSRGALYTGLFAGLASSTAATLSFSRAARRNPASAPFLATGVLLACGTMFPRMLLVAALLNRQLLQPLSVPAAVMALVTYGSALYYWQLGGGNDGHGAEPPLDNPLELKSAVVFGALLALVTFLGKALKAWLGTAGVLMLAGASGVADVDAITLSLARMSQDELGTGIAVIGIVIAAAVNTLVKGAMAAGIGGKVLGLRVGLPLLAASACGLIVAWLLNQG